MYCVAGQYIIIPRQLSNFVVVCRLAPQDMGPSSLAGEGSVLVHCCRTLRLLCILLPSFLSCKMWGLINIGKRQPTVHSLKND